MAMLDNLPEDLKGYSAELAQCVFEGLSDRDRRLATNFVLRLAEDELPCSDRLMASIARDAVRIDGAESAARWTESLPDESLRGAATGRVAGAFYAEQDAQAAARWAEGVADQICCAGRGRGWPGLGCSRSVSGRGLIGSPSRGARTTVGPTLRVRRLGRS